MKSRTFYNIALRLLPEVTAADDLVAFVNFVSRHHRLPGKRESLNDRLYLLKTTDAIVEPLRVFVSDKEYVKIFVKAMVGDQYNVPTLKILRNAEEAVEFDYPVDSCIKPTHMSGHVQFSASGVPPDRDVIRSWFSMSHYRQTRERNYKALVPKVIVEPVVFGDLNVSDYKIFCYRGSPRLVQVDVDRRTNHKRKYFDPHWREQHYSLLFPRADRAITKPANLEDMLSVAAKVSTPFDLVRVDLYSDGQQCMVGEITNCHGNAGDNAIPLSAEDEITAQLFGSIVG